MIRIVNGFFDCIKRKKVYFVLLIVAAILAIVLGVIAAINLSDEALTSSLSNIAYIRFLKDEIGFVSMIFTLVLSLCIFFSIIFLCHWKSFLIPLGFLFYLYLIYSQIVIFLSMILVYGIFNCIIFAVLLLVYILSVWFVFVLIVLELSCFTNSHSYFKDCCSMTRAKVLMYFIIMMVATVIFSLILLILKNYIILLVF